MAKTGIFLRGARGKFAGSVLYKGEKGTVIRENVVPANPQSSKQMYQRVSFATVAAAAKVMLPVIGQTFEGSASEVVNRRRFMAENVNALKEAFKTAPYAAGIPKGYPVLVPNRYVMSRGTLRMPSGLRLKDDVRDSSVQILCATNMNWDLPVGTYTPLEVLSEVYELKPGQQVTFCVAAVSNGINLYGDDTDYLRASRFIARRVVVKDDLSGVASLNVTAQTTSEQLKAYFATLFDADKSDALLLDKFTSFAETEISATGASYSAPWIEGWYTDLPGDIDFFVGGLSVIVSQQVGKSWQYTNSEMLIELYFDPTRDGYYGLRYATAVPTYMAGSAGDSSKFTQAGGNDNSVG